MPTEVNCPMCGEGRLQSCIDKNLIYSTCDTCGSEQADAIQLSINKLIKDMPILTGEDAKRFEKVIQENASRKVSEEEYKRAVKVFYAVMEGTK